MDKNTVADRGQAGENAAAGRPLCIVVADDERDAVLSLMMVLRDEGYETHGAYTAQQTFDAVLKYEPDVLILDIALGRLSGYEVAQKIRDRHGNGQPMIIGISGVYKKASDRILAEMKGFSHFLTKPCAPGEVLKLIAPLRKPLNAPPASSDVQEDEIYRAAVVRAAVLLGGARELGQRLQIGMTDLTRWLAGKEKPPRFVFLRVVDIILEERQKGLLAAAAAEVQGFQKRPGSGSS